MHEKKIPVLLQRLKNCSSKGGDVNPLLSSESQIQLAEEKNLVWILQQFIEGSVISDDVLEEGPKQPVATPADFTL